MIASVPAGLAVWVALGPLTSFSFMAILGGIIAAVIAAQMWAKSLRRLDATSAELLKGAAVDAPIQLGEYFDSGRVMVSDNDMLYLVARRRPVIGGLIRSILAAASVAFGVYFLKTTMSVGFVGTKPLFLAMLALVVVPTLLAFPFTVSWGASRTADDGEPGLVLERVWFFFVPRIQTIGSAKIAGLRVERVGGNGGEFTQLCVEDKAGNIRRLASAARGSFAEGRLDALKTAIIQAVH